MFNQPAKDQSQPANNEGGLSVEALIDCLAEMRCQLDAQQEKIDVQQEQIGASLVKNSQLEAALEVERKLRASEQQQILAVQQQQHQKALQAADPVYQKQKEEAEAATVNWLASDNELKAKGYLTPLWESYRKAARSAEIQRLSSIHYGGLKQLDGQINRLVTGFNPALASDVRVRNIQHQRAQATQSFGNLYSSRGWNPGNL